MLDGTIAGHLADLVDEVLPQPSRLRLGVGAHHDLVHVLRGEQVLHGGERLVVEDLTVRSDAGEAQRREHAVEPAAGGSATGVAIDDVALSRLGHRCDDGDANRASLRPRAQRVDELGADERLVRNDEHGRRRLVGHACTSSCTSCASLAGLRIAWRAPGTPYS